MARKRSYRRRSKGIRKSYRTYKRPFARMAKKAIRTMPTSHILFPRMGLGDTLVEAAQSARQYLHKPRGSKFAKRRLIRQMGVLGVRGAVLGGILGAGYAYGKYKEYKARKRYRRRRR